MKYRSIGKIVFLLFLVTGGIFVSAWGQNTILSDSLDYTELLNQARKNSKLSPKDSYQRMKECYRFFAQNNDTAKIIVCLMDMANLQSELGKFSLAFDHLWEAQYFSQKRKDNPRKALVHINLARLYKTFSMESQVLEHLSHAVSISKNLYRADKTNTRELISSYMNLAVYYRGVSNYTTALNYLDSCFIDSSVIENHSIEIPFWDAEKGYILLLQKKYTECRPFLFSAYRNTPLNAPYITNINMYLGDYYMGINRPDSAENYYIKSLNLIKNRKIRSELTTEVLFKLSKLYQSTGKIHRAYDYLSKSKALADSILQLKNQTNKELFEIKNKYLNSISAKNEELARQQIVIEKNRQIQTRLKIILALVIVLAGVVTWVIRIRFRLRRAMLEKHETEMRSKLAADKSRAELKTKSKELTSYALQLIDKESAIDELLRVIHTEAPNAYRGLSNKFKKGSQDLWDEFNLRFTEVNSAFYERLHEKQPNLSPTERKHCALIKLNFATKEMSRILNIAPHSVHISRSRIRKKIGLKRNESLERYIAEL